ncbi:MAG: hypothetical protein K0U41_06580 [Gammaproteobacteria bacterium]|nr:hypothetical protein [Gammaproteobacteria bacterium]
MTESTKITAPPTEEEIQERAELVQSVIDSVPMSRRSAISEEYVEKLLSISDDPTLAEGIIRNFKTYATILKEGKYKMDHYLDAIKFISLLNWNHTRKEAYEKTFPDTYKDWVARGLSNKEILSRVSSFFTGKLVQELIEQIDTPAWILHMPRYHEAVEVSVDLMHNASSEKVRADAANNLMTHLKKPESLKQLEMDAPVMIGKSELESLQDKLYEIADMNQQLIKQGELTTTEVAKARIIEPDATDADFEDVTPDTKEENQDDNSSTS